MTLNQIFISLIILLALAILAVAWLMFLAFKRRRELLSRSLNMELFSVSLPKQSEGQEKKDEKELISVMEQLYNGFASAKEKGGLFSSPPHFAFEIANSGDNKQIVFYLSTPQGYSSLAEKQIHSFYPEAIVEKVRDYNIFNPTGQALAAYLKQSKNQILPIRTYQQLEADPLKEIINVFSKIKEQGEGASIQLLFRPTTNKKWHQVSKEVAKEMQQGKSFNRALAEKTGNFLARIIRELRGSAKKSQDQQELAEKKADQSVTPGDQEIIKAIEGKAGKVGFDVNLRILASAETEQRAEELLNHLESAFSQFNSANLNSLQSKRVKGRTLFKKLIYHYSFRLFNPKQKMLLNTEELTSFFHLPSNELKTPNVKSVKSGQAAPPAEIPQQGILLGRNLYRGEETQIRIGSDDRRRHMYIIGQTGTGKSTFLKNLIVQDIQQGNGVGVLDPHGDLIEDVLGLIPKERAEEVVLIEPGNLSRPVGLNMLEYDPAKPEQKTFVVNEMIQIFDRLYDLKATGGPMFEQYMRNALLLLMDDPSEKATLLEVPRVLADADFRKRLLAKCQNNIIKNFWQEEAEKTGGDASLQNIVPYITSKFSVFIANDFMRPMIAQKESAINFQEIINNKKILLVNLSKGKLGDLNSRLLGMIVTGKLLMAAFSRVDMPEEQRNDFYLYMDEFQNFTTDSIATILSEARKYRLCLIIGHQYIGQLPEDIKSAVFGNVGSMAAFRVSAEDAEFLAKQFEPVFKLDDLINIDNFNAHLKLMLDNKTSNPFNMSVYPPEKGNPEMSGLVKEFSSLTYGRDREAVEADINQRWEKSGVPAKPQDSAIEHSWNSPSVEDKKPEAEPNQLKENGDV